MLIKQVIDLRKVRTELKIWERTSRSSYIPCGWLLNNTGQDYFQQQIDQKVFELQVKGRQSMQVFTWPSDLCCVSYSLQFVDFDVLLLTGFRF